MNNMQLMQRLKQYPWVVSQLATHCPYCGGEIHTTENLKKRYCSNPICILKTAKKGENMLKYFGIKRFGEATVMRVMQGNNMKSHFDLLNYNMYSKQPDLVLMRFAKEKKKITRDKLLELAQYPDIGPANAISLTANVKAFKEILHPTVQEKLWELEYAESLVEIIEPKVKKRIVVPIMITGSIKGYSRKGFIEYVNSLFGEYYIVEDANTALRAKLLIRDFASSSTKSREALKRGIPIMSSLEFIKTMKIEALTRYGEVIEQ